MQNFEILYRNTSISRFSKKILRFVEKFQKKFKFKQIEKFNNSESFKKCFPEIKAQFILILLTFRSERDPQDRNVSFFLDEIIYLGRIYDFETENEHLVTAFQQFLDLTIDLKPSSNASASLSFESIISRLTPKCDDLLLKCFFKSKQYKCVMDYEMMEQRRNTNGYCCSFNYMRRNDNNPL